MLINTEGIINQISDIRAKNNLLWMDILKLAFIHTPKEAKKLMQEIIKNDSEISKLSRRLAK